MKDQNYDYAEKFPEIEKLYVPDQTDPNDPNVQTEKSLYERLKNLLKVSEDLSDAVYSYETSCSGGLSNKSYRQFLNCRDKSELSSVSFVGGVLTLMDGLGEGRIATIPFDNLYIQQVCRAIETLHDTCLTGLTEFTIENGERETTTSRVSASLKDYNLKKDATNQGFDVLREKIRVLEGAINAAKRHIDDVEKIVTEVTREADEMIVDICSDFGVDACAKAPVDDADCRGCRCRYRDAHKSEC